MINTKNNPLAQSKTGRQAKSEKEKKLDLIMAELNIIENRRVEIMKEAKKILNSERLNNLRKKFLNN